MVKGRFLLFWIVFLLGLSLSPLFSEAAPVLQATYSERVLRVNEWVTVEAAFSWPAEDGPYYFSSPEWDLQNLAFYDRSRSEDSFTGAAGRRWQRVTFRYRFKPFVDGKALIGFIRIPYVNGPTQETGVVTIARQMEYRIRQKWDYLLMLTDMLCLMSGMLFAASLLILLHTRYAMKKALDEQKANEDKEYRAIPEKIEKAKGSQKARAFEWGTQFKIFLIRRYRLDRTVLTEQEAAALLSHRSDIPEADGVKISGLHERLLSLKFSTKEWEEQPFERLKNDLLDFIRRRL